MVIFMAALLDVPKEQYEAAELDGAGAWQRFRYVTLPNISPIVMFAVVTGVIQTMQYYTQAAGRRKGRLRRHRSAPARQFEPGYPDQLHPHPPAARLQRSASSDFNTGAACVLALVLFALAMAVHRAPDAPARGGLLDGGGLTA